MSAIQVVHKNGQFIFALCSEEKFVIYVSPPYDRGRRRGGVVVVGIGCKDLPGLLVQKFPMERVA